MLMAQQPNQLQATVRPQPVSQPVAAQPDLVAERLRQAPLPDANIAPTDPRALDRLNLPNASVMPPASHSAPPSLAAVRMEGTPQPEIPAGMSTTPANTVGAPPNAPFPFTPRPEEPDLHEHGKPIGFGSRVVHALKSAGMGFMRGGVGGAAAGAIGGAIDPDFYHRAQHYYRDLPLWQQRQQDEIEQAKTQQGLNESNARIGNIGVDNDLAAQRLKQEAETHTADRDQRSNAARTSAEERAYQTWLSHGDPNVPASKAEALRMGRPELEGKKPPPKQFAPKNEASEWDKITNAQGKVWYVNKLTGAKRAVEGVTAHVPADPNAVTDTEDVFGFPEGSETPAAHSKRKQEALTQIDSQVARGDLEPDEAAKMKLSWDNANPPPKPQKIGSRRAKTSGGGGGKPGVTNSKDPRIGKTATRRDGTKVRVTGIDSQGDPITEVIQ